MWCVSGTWDDQQNPGSEPGVGIRHMSTARQRRDRSWGGDDVEGGCGKTHVQKLPEAVRGAFDRRLPLAHGIRTASQTLSNHGLERPVAARKVTKAECTRLDRAAGIAVRHFVHPHSG